MKVDLVNESGKQCFNLERLKFRRCYKVAVVRVSIMNSNYCCQDNFLPPAAICPAGSRGGMSYSRRVS